MLTNNLNLRTQSIESILSFNKEFLDKQPKFVEGFELALKDELSDKQRNHLEREIYGLKLSCNAISSGCRNSQSIQNITKFATAALEIYSAALTCGPVGAYATAAICIFNLFTKNSNSGFQEFANAIMNNLQGISEQIYQVHLEEKRTQKMILNGFEITHEKLEKLFKSISHGFKLLNQKLDYQHSITHCNILINTQLALSHNKSAYELLADKLNATIAAVEDIVDGSITDNLAIEVPKAERALVSCFSPNKKISGNTLTGKHFMPDINNLDTYEWINTVVLNKFAEEKLNDAAGFLAEYAAKELAVRFVRSKDTKSQKRSQVELENVLVNTSLNNTNDIIALLDEGANPNLRMPNDHPKAGWPILLLAGHVGNTQLVKALLEHGANIYARNDLGQGLLTVTVWNSHIDTIQYLFRNHANAMRYQLNIACKQGRYPLHDALQNSDNIVHTTKVIELLIDLGADKTLKNKLGQTPAEAASSANLTSLAIIISTHQPSQANFLAEEMLSDQQKLELVHEEERRALVCNPQFAINGASAYINLVYKFPKYTKDFENRNLNKVKNFFDVNRETIEGYQNTPCLYSKLFELHHEAVQEITQLSIAAIEEQNQKLTMKFGKSIDLMTMDYHAIINLFSGEFLPDMPIEPGNFTCFGQAVNGQLLGLAQAENYPSFRQCFRLPDIEPIYIALMKGKMISMSTSADANLENIIYDSSYRPVSISIHIYSHIKEKVLHILESKRFMVLPAGIDPKFVAPSISQRFYGAETNECNLPGIQADEAMCQATELFKTYLMGKITEAMHTVIHSPIFQRALHKLDACKRLLAAYMHYAGFRIEEMQLLNQLWDSHDVKNHYNCYIQNQELNAPLPHTTLALNTDELSAKIINKVNLAEADYFQSENFRAFLKIFHTLDVLAEIREQILKNSHDNQFQDNDHKATLIKMYKNYSSKFKIWSATKYQDSIPENEKDVNGLYGELTENLITISSLLSQINNQLESNNPIFLTTIIEQMKYLINKCCDVHVGLKHLSRNYTFDNDDFYFIKNDRQYLENISVYKNRFFQSAPSSSEEFESHSSIFRSASSR